MSTEQAAAATAAEVAAAATEETAPVETPTETAPTETAPAPNKEQEQFASKFAALSRKEKQFRDERKAFEAERAKYEAEKTAREQELKDKYLPIERIKDRKQILKTLADNGINFKDLAEMVLNDGNPTAEHLTTDLEQRMNAKVQELEKKLADKEAKEQEDRTQQTIHEFKNELNTFIDTTKDANGQHEYELIRAQDAQEMVFEVIETHYKNTEKEFGEGVLLTNKQAADAVEKFLLDEAKKLIDREKVKKLLPQPTVQPKPGQKAAPTLSNTQSTTVTQKESKYLSDEESKKEAAKLIKWID